MELGLLVLRLLLGLILFCHALQKLLGWFSGPGLAGAATIFEGLGQRPGRQMALLAAGCELLAAILLGLGLLTPLGAAVAAGTMAVAGASSTMVAGAVWTARAGGEYPFVLAALAVVVGFTGPGGWSLDAILAAPYGDLGPPATVLRGVVVLVVAMLAAVPPTLRARRALVGRARDTAAAN